jgi:hypothetical protein
MTRWLDACWSGAAPGGAGGTAASGIVQPTQQQSAHILPLLSAGAGDSCPAIKVWQMMPPGTEAASAAARAAPKLASRLDSAIA